MDKDPPEMKVSSSADLRVGYEHEGYTVLPDVTKRKRETVWFDVQLCFPPRYSDYGVRTS